MHLVIKSETGRNYEYHSDQKSFRTVKTQIGTRQFTPFARQTRANISRTPVKLQKNHHQHLKSITPKSPEVINLPTSSSKKSTAKSVAKTTEKRNGKFDVCKVIWKSREDAVFVKKVGKRKRESVSYDKKRCNYWGHATCVGPILTIGKAVQTHDFFCYKQKQ